MQSEARNIFISYRRADAPGHAGRIYDSLARVFGENQLFMDVSAIQPGETFADRIDRTLNASGAVLVIIGREWMNRLKIPESERRQDFVRRELTTALKSHALVVPVLVEGAGMPMAQDLPEDLRPLAERNAIEVSDTRWDHDMARLSDALAQAPGVNKLPAGKPEKKAGSRLLWIAGGIIAVGVLAFGTWTISQHPGGDGAAIPAVSPTPVARERVLFHLSDHILQDFLERLTAAVEQHDWRMVLTLFQGSNFKGQTEIGIDQPQYIAEGLGLHMAENSLVAGDGERIEFAHLDEIKRIELTGMTGPDNEGLLTITGFILRRDGSRLKVEIPLRRTETGGYELAPAVG